MAKNCLQYVRQNTVEHGFVCGFAQMCVANIVYSAIDLKLQNTKLQFRNLKCIGERKKHLATSEVLFS